AIVTSEVRMNEGPEDPMADEDEDSEEDYDDGGDADDMMSSLFATFTDFMNIESMEVDEMQTSLLRFASMASQVLLFSVCAAAREEKLNVDDAALDWIRESCRMFVDMMADRDTLRTVAQIVGEPELNLRLDRKFRRSLF